MSSNNTAIKVHSLLDRTPAYAKDAIQIAEWMKERKEKFGDHFNEVNGILAEFEAMYGIYLTDVHPGNIRFAS